MWDGFTSVTHLMNPRLPVGESVRVIILFMTLLFAAGKERKNGGKKMEKISSENEGMQSVKGTISPMYCGTCWCWPNMSAGYNNQIHKMW